MRALAALALSVVLAACAAPQGPSVPRGTQPVPAEWLTELEPQQVTNREQAEAALKRLELASAERLREFLIAERACYGRFLVNSCVEDVLARRRMYEQRYSVLQIHARQVIRNDDQFQLNRGEAESNSERERERSQQLAEQLQARQDFEQRQKQANEKQAERDRAVQRLAAEQPQREARQAQLQADVAERQAELSKRQAQAASNAKLRAQREQEQAIKLRERDARLAKQREEAAKKQRAREQEQLKQAQRQAEREARKAQTASKPVLPVQPGVLKDVP